MKKEEEEEKGEGKEEEKEEEDEAEFFVEKNPTKELLVPIVPLQELFLQRKRKRMSRK
jgi:hypothetical protein